jgi:flagellar biosynthesis protein FliR
VTDLLPLLAQAVGLAGPTLQDAFAVFLRVGGLLAVLPAFGEQSVPVRVRLAIALAFTAVVLPAVADALPDQRYPGALFLSEVAAGLILGLGLRLLIMALMMAGTLAAQSASVSQLFGGAAPEPQPAFANLFVMAGLALAVMSGLHVRAAELLILSYDILPAGRPPLPGDVAQWGLGRVSHAFGLAFSLAAPFVLAALIYNLALGVINRAMPQMMVALVGAPALSLGALALLAITAPALMQAWMAALSVGLAQPFAVIP